MTRYLTISEIISIYQQVMRQSGGLAGIRDLGALESAAAQPRATFDGQDLYPSIAEKAATLAFALIQNHPFIDGNKRIGHAAMEIFLVLNGYEIQADVDEQEHLVLRIASSAISRVQLTEWIQHHLQPS